MPIRQKPRTPSRDDALGIGLSALAFLTEDITRLTRFMSLTGMSPDVLRTQAQSPALLSAVLDHLLQDESLLLVFTSTNTISPDAVAPARDLLQRF